MIERIPNFHFGPLRKITFTGGDGDPYMTRVRSGQLLLHVFHRADNAPDPHDHEEDFWTFPLTSYVEEVMNPETHAISTNVVRGWRISHRPAEHTHRVTATLRWERIRWTWRGPRIVRVVRSKWPLVTINWRGKQRRAWGFWVSEFHPTNAHRRVFMPWRDYLFTDWRAALAKARKRRAMGAS